MAQIKIVVTIESTLVRDAHAAVDAMDAYLRQHEGRVVHARLVPVQEAAREPEPAAPEVCSSCGEPAHPSETDDLGRCEACHGDVGCECGEWSGEHCTWRGNRDERVQVEYMPEQFRSSHVTAGNRGSYPANGSRRIRVSEDCLSEMLTRDGEWCEELEEDDGEECADCGASTAAGTPSPHECAPAMPESAPLVHDSDDIFEAVMTAMQPAEELEGPDGAQYVALMEQIACEAQRRANTMRDTLAGTAEEVRS